MKPILFNIGPIPIYGYGLMIGIGILAGLLLAVTRAKKANLDADKIFSMFIISMIAGFSGGKLLYIIVEWETFLYAPFSVIGSSGFVVYGGILAGILSIYVYCKIKKIEFFKYVDFLMPSLAIGQGFGRIGCFFAGCCFGRECHVNVPHLVFPENSLALPNTPLIPTQIYSSIGDFILMAILLIVEKKTRNKRIKGLILGLYLILYSIGRYVIEIFRGDIRGEVGILSTSQFISIFMLIAGVGIILVSYFIKAVKKN